MATTPVGPSAGRYFPQIAESPVGFDLGLAQQFLSFLQSGLHYALVLRQAEHGPLDEGIVPLDFAIRASCCGAVSIKNCMVFSTSIVNMILSQR
ncbi:MAG TPA: hypothetical protein VEV17_13235 [Bryobacteraceae bacterium]|nr:hypothetical protein [Bryobacteraceae bacterium]